MKNLRHLMELAEGGTGEFIRIELDEGRLIVLRRSDVEEAWPRILLRHRIASRMSSDLEEASGLDAGAAGPPAAAAAPAAARGLAGAPPLPAAVA